MTNYVLAAIVCSALLTGSCSDLLIATFESDAINGTPATNLTGSPSGDVIQFHAAMTSQLKVQSSEISGDKALFYTNIAVNSPPPLSSRWISFKGTGTDLTQTIWFKHTGENMGSSIMIDVSDGHLNLIARMRIQPDGEVGLSTALNDLYSDVIGNLAAGAHTIIFTAFTSTLKYNVTIIQTSVPTITVPTHP